MSKSISSRFLPLHIGSQDFCQAGALIITLVLKMAPGNDRGRGKRLLNQAVNNCMQMDAGRCSEKVKIEVMNED